MRMSTICLFWVTTVGLAFAQPAIDVKQAKSPETKEVRLLVGGDVMVGRYMGARLRLHGGPDPFAFMAPLASQADLTLINLETPVSDEDPARIKRGKNLRKHSVLFRMPSSYAALMSRHGVDVAVLANNHAEDCGRRAIADTIEHLSNNQITPVGAHPTEDPYAPVVIKRNGFEVVVLAASLWRNVGFPRPGEKIPVAYLRYKTARKILPEQVKKLAQEKPERLIVVSMHWAKEGMAESQGWQRQFARSLIDSGAHLVWGHHPHVLQPVEVRGRGIILYSTGNLVFDMLGKTKRSALFDVGYSRDADGAFKLTALSATGVTLGGVKDSARLATEKEARTIFRQLIKDSQKRHRTPLTLSGNKIVWRPAKP